VRDARFFASCVDGVRDLQETAPDTYAAVFETKVAYMKFAFKVSVQVVHAEPPQKIEAKIEGTPLGIVGRLTATSLTTLAEAGGDTKISYDVEAALTGKLGSLGQPVLRSKAKEMEKQFAARLAAAFATPGTA
jgi:carbon monoxide dehydrogenase subunit G